RAFHLFWAIGHILWLLILTNGSLRLCLTFLEKSLIHTLSTPRNSTKLRFGGPWGRSLLGKNKALPNLHKNGWDEEQSANGRENESPDDRAPKRSILLSTFS